MHTQEFFKYVSQKFRKENDLSDITWAMCQSCESFRDAFLKFFFPEIIIEKSISIEREKSEDDSRPDFYIENDGKRYLIENKIYDTNHHFGQYDNTFNVDPNRFGYITNYEISDDNIRQKGYRLHTWEELFNYFSKEMPVIDEEKPLLNGYLEYIKNVCGIIKIEKPMKLDGIYSLFSLMEIFEKKLAKRDEELFSVSLYNSNKLCGNGNSHGATGVNFELKYKNVNTNRIWGWIGIYYDREKPLICMGFYDNPNWGKGYVDMLRSHKGNWTNQDCFEKPYFEDSTLFFDMSERLRDAFNASEEIEEQEAILKRFMDEVLTYPFSFFK